MLISILKKLPQPVETTPARLTAAIHQNKSQFAAIGRGTYTLCKDYYQQLLDASTKSE